MDSLLVGGCSIKLTSGKGGIWLGTKKVKKVEIWHEVLFVPYKCERY